MFIFNADDVDEGADDYIYDFEPGVDRLQLASGLVSETYGSIVRVFKAPAVGFGLTFGFESDDATFGFEIDGDGAGL